MIVKDSQLPYVKEIQNTQYLISLNHSFYQSAHLKIFDLSKKGTPKSVYRLEEVFGGKFTLLRCISSTSDHQITSVH